MRCGVLSRKDRQNEAHGCFVCSFYGGCVPWNGQHGADGFGGCGCPRGVWDTLIYICTCSAYFRIFSSCGKKLSSLSLRKARADNGGAFHRRQFGSDNISPIKSRRSDSNDSKKRLLPHSLHNRLGGRDDNIFHGRGVKAWSVFKRSRLRLDGGST